MTITVVAGHSVIMRSSVGEIGIEQMNIGGGEKKYNLLMLLRYKNNNNLLCMIFVNKIIFMQKMLHNVKGLTQLCYL